MLHLRTVAKLSSQLIAEIDILKSDKAHYPEQLKSQLKDLNAWAENEYQAFKQIEKSPTVVYQMFGKKTTELSPDEQRKYKALLKRQRDARKRELKKT